MNASLVAVVFSSVAMIGAFFLAPRDTPALPRILAVWFGVTVIAFLIPAAGIALIFIGFLLSICALTSRENRIYIFIAAQFIIPSGYSAEVPFPGLNYLIDLNYSDAITLILLGPIFISALSRRQPEYLKSVDLFLLAYVLITGISSIRDLPFTSMLRNTTELFISLLLPYIAISRTLNTADQFDKAIKALLLGAAFLGGVGVISALRDWNYYTILPGSGVVSKMFTEYRFGFLRVYATLSKPLLGLFMGAGIACALYCMSQKSLPKIKAAVLLAILGFTAFVTGSRGGWMGAGAVLGAYLIFMMNNPLFRRVLVAGGLAGVGGLFAAIGFFGFSLDDEFGTFSYRAELLKTSIQQIQARPFFGATNVSELPAFQHLIQGEGIVDFVNMYIQIALRYGLIGFGAIAAVNYMVVRGGLRVVSKLEKDKRRRESGDILRRQILLMTAIMLSFFLVAATTSGISYMWNFAILILSLLTAQARCGFALAVSKEPGENPSFAPEDAAPRSAAISEKPRPSSRIYYGARHIRPLRDQ